MILLDAVEMFPAADLTPNRRMGHLDLMLDLLNALAESEHPYAYLMATEPRKTHKRRA